MSRVAEYAIVCRTGYREYAGNRELAERSVRHLDDEPGIECGPHRIEPWDSEPDARP